MLSLIVTFSGPPDEDMDVTTVSLGPVSGAPSASTSTLVASPVSVTANGTSTTTLTVTVRDASGNLLPNTAVMLSANGTGNTFGPNGSSGTTNSSGVFTTTLASTVAQTETITASEGGVLETPVSVTFNPGLASASTSTLVASLGPVATGTPTTLTVTVKDANGNLVPNTAVTLSASGAGNSFGTTSGTTNASGVFTTTLSSTVAQTETITATEGSIHESASVTFVSLSTGTVIEALGSTKLVEVGTNFFLDLISTGSGPTLKYGGAAVVANQFGAWAPIGAEQTATGYEVAWKIPGADQYTVWNTDSSGNYISNVVGVVSGTSAALELLETSFHQDLNGDGTIGAPTVTIEALGSTKLVEVGTNFFLDLISTGSGPTLKYGGAAVVANQFGAWAPIGAEQTATGYEVAWKIPGADQYTVWNTDSSGNYISNVVGVVSGTSAALESLETSFHQDLNGDGTIGAPTVTIEALGSTKLVEVGTNFFLDLISTGSGPTLKYGGAAVVANQFGAWAPIGAEQTATGYEVAWKIPGADQYTVWNTDSSGNYISNVVGVVSGTSAALESLETSFHQDLNGDGTIGAPTVTIEALGSTKLVEVGTNFFLDLISTGSGPTLKYGGAAVVANQFGAWAPIGAEQTATGYEVAWKIPGADQYTVWNTDSSGNYISNVVGVVSGTSAALESLETSFHQDLNGDGTIGLATALAPSTAFIQSAVLGPSKVDLTFGVSLSISATMIGFEGDGSLPNSDQIDLHNLSHATLQPSYNNSTGILTLSDGAKTANLQFLGNHTLDSFRFADDGTGGTTTYAGPPTDGAATTSVTVASLTGDVFIFAPNFGQATLSHFDPLVDTLQINHSVFADVNSVLASAHDTGTGNVSITDGAHDSLTIENTTLTQLEIAPERVPHRLTEPPHCFAWTGDDREAFVNRLSKKPSRSCPPAAR